MVAKIENMIYLRWYITSSVLQRLINAMRRRKFIILEYDQGGVTYNLDSLSTNIPIEETINYII